MTEDASLEFRLVKKEIKKEAKRNQLISKKHKKTCRYFNYAEDLIILPSKIATFVSISTFAAELNICVITARIKNYKVKYQKKRKKHYKMTFLRYPN